MKIGIEAQRLFRPNKHGMDWVALELIRNLMELDSQNEYVVFVRPDRDVCLENSKNFTTAALSGSFYPWWEQIRLPLAAKREHVDLLHCTSNTAPVRRKVPLLLTLHDVIYLEPGASNQPGGSPYQRAGALYRRWIVPRIVHGCDRVITVSEYERRRIARLLGISDARLVVIYNGVGAHFRPQTDSARLADIQFRYDLPHHFVLFLGNTDPKKNVTNVLLGYRRYCQSEKEPLPLVILDYKREHLKKCLASIRAQEIESKIVLPGYIGQSDLPAVYSLATVFLYPSLRESFGLPILEAMACGVPVMTSDCTAMPEIAGSAAEQVDPTDPEQIGRSLARLTTDDALRRRLIRSGFERASHFSWQRTAEQVLDLYQRVHWENRSGGFAG